MARGWAKAGGPELMLFTDSGSGRAAELAAQVGGEALTDNSELAARADLLILGCKPKDLETVAPGAQGSPAVLSLLGATSVDRIATAFPGSAAFRVMPNLGVELNRGVLCLSMAGEPPQATAVKDLLALLGSVVELEDAAIDAATAVMGCSPAYLDLFVDALADAGAWAGLDPEQSRAMVLDTFAGTLELLRERKPGELRRAVASPGGSTEAGLESLADDGFESVAARAVEASLARMQGER